MFEEDLLAIPKDEDDFNNLSDIEGFDEELEEKASVDCEDEGRAMCTASAKRSEDDDEVSSIKITKK